MTGHIINKAKSVDLNTRSGSHIYPGTYVAEVMDNKDVGQKAGRLWVYIPEFGGIKDDESSWVPVSYASPFYGISPHTVPQKGSEDNTPVTTYGFWAIPPDVGVRVLCTFITGSQTLGYWFAVVPTVSHGMIPAMGAPDGKTPMADFNPLSPEVGSTEDLSSIERQPYEPLTTQFSTQGIQEDPLRGPITSSSFRESPSRVFGISSQTTPESPGHSFVMDDGDEGGKNKLIRIRSSSGNQITMHDDTGMIYLINAQGTGWIELSPSGQIDVFGAAGVNLASPGDINLHADNNVSIHAGNCVKIVGVNGTKVQGGSELQLHGAKTMIEGVDSLHVHSCKEMMITSYGDIHMKAFNYFCLKGKCFYWNSCTAKEAEQVPPEQPQDVSGYQTTVARAPNKEPYKEHDNGQSQGAPGAAPGGDPGGGAGGMDTAATSLGGNFSLGFSTGLPGNNANLQNSAARTSLDRLSTTARNSVSSMGMSFNSNVKPNSGSGMSFTPDITSNFSGNTVVDYATINNAKTSLQNAQRVNGTTTTQSTLTVNNTTTKYYPSTTTQVGPMGKDVTSPSTLDVTQDGKTTRVQSNTPTQGPDVFNSQNPADKALTSPAQDASSALDQALGQMPSSDLQPPPGGGGTGCFATGDNCQRPADETGGGGGGGDSGQGAAQNGPGDGYGDVDRQKVEDEIRRQAIAKGMDPDKAVAVARAEGLNKYIGDNGYSGGPYQLYYGSKGGGGLGTQFTRQTGINALTDRSWGSIQKQINFSLDYAKRNGWQSAWYGARNKGISGY